MRFKTLMLVFLTQKFCHCGWPKCCVGASEDKSTEKYEIAAVVGGGNCQSMYSDSFDTFESDSTVVSPGPSGEEHPSMVVLDLCSENMAYFDVVSNDDYGLINVSYFPKSGHCIREVLDSDGVIWTVKEGGKCLGVHTYSKDSKTMLTLLVGMGGINRNSNYRKVNGKWVKVEDSMSFKMMIQDLKGLSNGPIRGPRKRLTSKTFVPYSSE
ncbi:signal peptide containing protein [Theileria equi strain WA]|uniref:Signal peptide containing protein n=1 Tax=Theileria equi strain WA TaxID=1537102 RepID=L1LE43_THEEQ|nr:signal peptide containing protein [Theileria equi strain WA]EKX73520.1 signal peptide containing protein [Theileria equi strain WA]|eukprot:XP_004832972.1 signal peptide containing protein [Theileria equi strain WA]